MHNLKRKGPHVRGGSSRVKILVTGNSGMLGRDLVPILQRAGYTAHGVDIDHLDITQENDVHQTIESCMPDLVMNCAAYTAVDKAESEREGAFAVNRDGAGLLAESLRQV